jgi:HlyD family secretion protein
MKKKILPVILLVIAISVISYFIYDYAADKIGKQSDAIEASGIIEVNTITLNASVNAKLIEAKYDEGDNVAAGETVARMDGSLLEKQIQITNSNIETARTQIEAAEIQYRQGVETAEETMEQSKIVKDYMSTYHHFIYYDEPITITKSDSDSSSTSTTESQSTTYSTSTTDLERGPDYTSTTESTLQQETTSDSRSSATSDSINYPGPSQKKSVLVQLQEAINQYNMALLKLEQVKENDTQVKIAGDNLTTAEAQLELYKQQIAELDIISPIEGVILNKLSEEGEYLLPGTPIYEIGDLYNVTCNIYIPEDKYGKIFLNQEVILTVDSYPDLEFIGVVSKISDRAEFTPKNIQTKQERVTTVYKITISLKNPDLRLKPGMPADVVINI